MMQDQDSEHHTPLFPNVKQVVSRNAIGHTNPFPSDQSYHT